MSDLFALQSSAVFSACGLYRHRLDREVQSHGLVLLYSGVNGSTAGAEAEDQTTMKWRGFTLRNNGRKYIAVNPFGKTAKDVKHLATVADPVGPENARHVAEAIAEADILIPCWGSRNKIPQRLWHYLDEMRDLFFASGKPVFTLEPTASQQFRASSYEIKISRADYLRDSAEKQDGALKWSDRFWYVTPPNLIEPRELPEWAGLQEWDGRTFRVRRKAPPRQKAAPDWEFIVSMLRNSGDCRRDVGLIKTQLSFLQQRMDFQDRQRKLRNQMTVDRWMAKANARALANGGPDA